MKLRLLQILPYCYCLLYILLGTGMYRKDMYFSLAILTAGLVVAIANNNYLARIPDQFRLTLALALTLLSLLFE